MCSGPYRLDHSVVTFMQANLPNLRRLFVDARTEAEESSYSRNAVRLYGFRSSAYTANILEFYNLILFMTSVAAFSLIGQRMSGGKTTTLGR